MRQVWLRVLRDSDLWVIALQIADPSSRQRERPTERRSQLQGSNLPIGHKSQIGLDTKTYWLTVSRKVSSTSNSWIILSHVAVGDNTVYYRCLKSQPFFWAVNTLKFGYIVFNNNVFSSVISWGTMLYTGRSQIRLPVRSLIPPHYGPEVDSASNRKEYQESFWE
jgi:hypothetical protein